VSDGDQRSRGGAPLPARASDADPEAERPPSGARWEPLDADRAAREDGRQKINRMTSGALARATRAAERLLRAAGRPPSPSETRACARLMYVAEAGRWAEGVLRELVDGSASIELRGSWRFVVCRKPAQGGAEREPAGPGGAP